MAAHWLFWLGMAATGSGLGGDAPDDDRSNVPETAFVLFEHRSALPPIGPPATFATPLRHDVGTFPPRRSRYHPLIRAAEVRHMLPAGLLDAVVATESAYMPWAVSRSGAAGLAQLMPATALALGVRDRFDPGQSIDGGARYLRQMLNRFGSVSLALAAYNAGPGSVRLAGGIPDNGETPRYVLRVLRRWAAGAAS